MIALHKHEISASIRNRYSNIVYLFDFENLNKNGSKELKFEITIDPNAFISKFEASIDGELFVGQTKEKQTASKEYKAAKRKNENAILISQPHKHIPNVFEIKTNIDAKSKVLLTLQIEQYLQKHFDFNQLNIQILRNFAKYNISQKFDHISFKIDIEDKSGIFNVNIPMLNNENIIIKQQIMDKMNQKYQINGRIMLQSSMNELIIKYKIKGEENDSHILFDTNSNTFCHIISDIVTDSNIAINKSKILIPRRVIFVIDRSGSMSGSKWDKTISATICAIQQLRNGVDRFGIILFDNNIQLLPYKNARGCILTNDQCVLDCIEMLQNEKTDGSTNINDALLKAIELIKIDILLLNNDNKCAYNFFINQIVFVTDGEANSGQTDTKKILTNVKNANDLAQIDKYNNKIGIFSFGVGRDGNDSGWIKDLNHSFLKLLSVNNNGFYQRIKQTSTDSILSEYFSILSKPILSNIDVKYNNKNVNNLTNTKFNTLYSGNDIIICGKIENNKDCTLAVTVSAITGTQRTENDKLITEPINITKKFKINYVINDINEAERIWAYLKLQQFAKQKLIYNDMIELDEDEQKEHESTPLALALKYKFVTPWSSMIVVKQKVDMKPENEPENEEEKKEEKENKIIRLEKQIVALKKRMQKSKGVAKQSYKQKALRLLKQKKQYEKQRSDMHRQQMNIDHTKFAQQTLKDNADMVCAMKMAATSLKTQYKELNIDQVEDLADDMMDLADAEFVFPASPMKSNPAAITSLYKIGRGRRGKKKGLKNKKKAPKPGLVRVQLDLDELELPPNVRLNIANKENLQQFQVAITLESGYWRGATYSFNFVIPDLYPYKPPKVTCVEKIYHPNIDLQGNISLNILGADWRPISTLQQIIHGLMLLFLEPNAADPLNEFAAQEFRNNINVFKQNVDKSLAGGFVGGTHFQKRNLKK